MACGPSKWKMAVGLTNLKMAFGPGLKMFFGIFWSQIRPYGLKLRSSILTFQGASFGVHGSPCRPHIWRNLWTPKTRKVLKKNLQKWWKNIEFGLKWLQKIQFGAWRPGSGSKFWSGCIGDGPGPQKPSFWPQILKNVEKPKKKLDCILILSFHYFSLNKSSKSACETNWPQRETSLVLIWSAMVSSWDDCGTPTTWKTILVCQRPWCSSRVGMRYRHKLRTR